MSEYYKMIDGNKYDRAMVEYAEKAVAGAGDGRLSLDDAKELIKFVTDAGKYTDIEKETVRYLRDQYNWTKPADDWFRTEISRWAATR